MRRRVVSRVLHNISIYYLYMQMQIRSLIPWRSKHKTRLQQTTLHVIHIQYFVVQTLRSIFYSFVDRWCFDTQRVFRLLKYTQEANRVLCSASRSANLIFSFVHLYGDVPVDTLCLPGHRMRVPFAKLSHVQTHTRTFVK